MTKEQIGILITTTGVLIEVRLTTTAVFCFLLGAMLTAVLSHRPR